MSKRELTIGYRLRMARMVRKRTLREVAKVSGVSWSTIRRVENEVCDPIASVRVRLERWIKTGLGSPPREHVKVESWHTKMEQRLSEIESRISKLEDILKMRAKAGKLMDKIMSSRPFDGPKA